VLDRRQGPLHRDLRTPTGDDPETGRPAAPNLITHVRCGDLFSRHHATSRSTHGDRAASGKTISTSQAEDTNADRPVTAIRLTITMHFWARWAPVI
jgi:hypothetical protein